MALPVALDHLISYQWTHSHGLPRLLPPIMGFDGDLILFIIMIIIIVVLTIMVVRFLNQSIELANQIEKEMKFSQDLEEITEDLQSQVENQSEKVRTLQEKVAAWEQYAQELEAQKQAVPEVPAMGQVSTGDYGDVEVVQHYEQIGKVVEGTHYVDVTERQAAVADEDDVKVVAPKAEPEPKRKKEPIVAKARVISIPTLAEWSTQQEFTIQDAFVIYKDGRLVTHLSKKIRIIDDSEIIGSMIAAVQMAVRESFKRESKGTLDALRFSDLTVLLEGGMYLNLAVVIRGRNYTRLKPIMKDVVENIHKAWGEDIEAWDGARTNVKAIEKVLQRDLLDRFETETFHSAGGTRTMDLSKAKVFKPDG